MSTLSQFFGSGGGAAGAPGTGQVTFFRENGSVTIPSDATYVAYGVMGGGGGTCMVTGEGNWAGAGGGFSYKELALTLPAPISVCATVGAGGATGGPGVGGPAASDGGTSCFTSTSPAWTAISATGGDQGCCTAQCSSGGTGSGGDINTCGGGQWAPSPSASNHTGGAGAGGVLGDAFDFNTSACPLAYGTLSFQLHGNTASSGGAFSINTGFASQPGLVGKAGNSGYACSTFYSSIDTVSSGESGWISGYTRDGRTSTAKTFFSAAGGGGGLSCSQGNQYVPGGDGGAGGAGGYGYCGYHGNSGFGAGGTGGPVSNRGGMAGCGGGAGGMNHNCPNASTFPAGGNGVAIIEFWETT